MSEQLDDSTAVTENFNEYQCGSIQIIDQKADGTSSGRLYRIDNAGDAAVACFTRRSNKNGSFGCSVRHIFALDRGLTFAEDAA